eukprot:8779921-Ditylum_brightwellii.AAC.1
MSLYQHLGDLPKEVHFEVNDKDGEDTEISYDGMHNDCNDPGTNAEVNTACIQKDDDVCQSNEARTVKPPAARTECDEKKDNNEDTHLVYGISPLSNIEVDTSFDLTNVKCAISLNALRLSHLQSNSNGINDQIITLASVGEDDRETSLEWKWDRVNSHTQSTSDEIKMKRPLSDFIVVLNGALFKFNNTNTAKLINDKKNSQIDVKTHSDQMPSLVQLNDASKQSIIDSNHTSEEEANFYDDNSDAKNIRWVPSMVRLYQYKMMREKTEGWASGEVLYCKNDRETDATYCISKM